MTDQYSNREIDRMFKDIQDALNRIEIQTTKTNGRVTTLRIWRGYLTGGIAILSVIVLPIAFWVMVQVVSNQGSAQTAATVNSR